MSPDTREVMESLKKALFDSGKLSDALETWKRDLYARLEEAGSPGPSQTLKAQLDYVQRTLRETENAGPYEACFIRYAGEKWWSEHAYKALTKRLEDAESLLNNLDEALHGLQGDSLTGIHVTAAIQEIRDWKKRNGQG